MKYLITAFIIFTIALRPILPLVNYAVNYDYIVENLCENKEKPELMCNGKCYVSKELSKTNTEQTTQNEQKISIPTINIFLVTEDFKFINSEFKNCHRQSISTFCADFYHSQYQSKIFHPPLV